MLGILGTPADFTPTIDDNINVDDLEGSDNRHDFDRSKVEPPEEYDFTEAGVRQIMQDNNIETGSRARQMLRSDFEDEVKRMKGEADADQVQDDVRDAHPPPIPEDELKVARITKADLEKFAYTGGCSRCARLEFEQARTKTAHSLECRRRFYQLFKTMGMPSGAALHRTFKGSCAGLILL